MPCIISRCSHPGDLLTTNNFVTSQVDHFKRTYEIMNALNNSILRPWRVKKNPSCFIKMIILLN